VHACQHLFSIIFIFFFWGGRKGLCDKVAKVDTYTRETTVGKCRKVTDQESEPLIKWARRTMEGYRAWRASDPKVPINIQ
jgi:hypothetical protein